MDSDFKGYGRAEKLLELHIPHYDKKNIVPDMIMEANALKYKISQYIISTEPQTFTIKDFHHNLAYWTISFIRPVFQYVPECFTHITTNVFYYNNTHRQYLEHVPSYLPNINHVALFVNYNENQPSFSDNVDGGIVKTYEPHDTLAEFSSLNILLPNKSKPKFIDESLIKFVRKTFEYCYWRFPFELFKNESCINNIIYASTSRVFKIISLRKTLVKIIEIKPHEENITYFRKNLSVKRANIMVLCDQGSYFFTKERQILILDEILEDTKEGDIINAMIAFDVNNKYYPLIIGKIGEVLHPDDLSCVVSVVLSKALQYIKDGSSPVKVSSRNDLESHTSRFLQTNNRMFDDIFRWDKNISKKITKSLDSLFPAFLEIDGNIYQLPPTLMTELTSFSSILEDRQLLELTLKFFDFMEIGNNMKEPSCRNKLRFSEEYANLQKQIPDLANTLLKSSPHIVNRIIYSRILSQHHKSWGHN